MYSKNQIRNWQIYERIRQSGMFNMFDPQARRMTTMSISEWLFCMEHYKSLRDAHEGVSHE